MTSEFEESLSLENAEAFFDNLGKQEVKEKKERKGSATAELGGNQGYIEQISRNTNWNEGIEKIIKQNLLIGNLEGAVECALKAGRTVYIYIYIYIYRQRRFCWHLREGTLYLNEQRVDFSRITKTVT